MNIYHRIFKLHQRNVSAQQIAMTTNMPLKSVRAIIRKFEGKNSTTLEAAPQQEDERYLDYHITKQHKYIVVDFSGYFTEEFKEVIDQAFEESHQKAGTMIAVKMDAIYESDDTTMDHLIAIKQRTSGIGKTVVILAPSDAVEEYIDSHEIEKHTRVFGTQSAFEEFAFRMSHSD